MHMAPGKSCPERFTRTKNTRNTALIAATFKHIGILIKTGPPLVKFSGYAA